jgi:hypothetical protein
VGFNSVVCPRLDADELGVVAVHEPAAVELELEAVRAAAGGVGREAAVHVVHQPGAVDLPPVHRQVLGVAEPALLEVDRPQHAADFRRLGGRGARRN